MGGAVETIRALIASLSVVFLLMVNYLLIATKGIAESCGVNDEANWFEFILVVVLEVTVVHNRGV